jgi:transposase-like protein
LRETVEDGKPVSAVAENYGLFPNNIFAWRKQLFEGAPEIFEIKRPVKELSEKIARLKKNSANSSKPPSSDITKPPKPEGGKGKNANRGLKRAIKSTKEPRFRREDPLTKPSFMNYRAAPVPGFLCRTGGSGGCLSVRKTGGDSRKFP